MTKINKLLVGESLVGEGNEVAHIDLLIGPRGSAAEAAFANALTNNKDGFTTLLAVVAPNLLVKPATVLFNKVTIKNATQAVQMFGPAQRGVAKAVADSVADGVIPIAEADDIFISVGVFIHWEAKDDQKIQDYNYQATKEAIARAIAGEPTPADRRRPAQYREASLRAELNHPPGSIIKGGFGPLFYWFRPARRQDRSRSAGHRAARRRRGRRWTPARASAARSSGPRTPPAA